MLFKNAESLETLEKLDALVLLSPMLAAAAMSLSSVSVIGNALRLRGQRLGQRSAGTRGGASRNSFARAERVTAQVKSVA